MLRGQIRSASPKKVTSMESPAGRLLRLLSLLQMKPTWTAEELAARLTITTRTVRRDVTRLRDLGYPVLAAPGRFGGYQLGPGGALPPLLLERRRSGGRRRRPAGGGRTAGSSGIEDAALAALAKLEQVLPVPLRERVQALHSATVPLVGGSGPSVDPDALVLVAQGCRRLERLRFAVPRRQRPALRALGRALPAGARPPALVPRGPRPRPRRLAHLPVDRIQQPVLTGHRFIRTEEPDAAAMVAEGLAVGAYSHQATVVLLVPHHEAAAEIPRTVGSLEAHDDGTLLRIGGSDLRWLSSYLAALPFAFRVIDPPELKDELRALGRRLVRDHG